MPPRDGVANCRISVPESFLHDTREERKHDHRGLIRKISKTPFTLPVPIALHGFYLERDDAGAAYFSDRNMLDLLGYLENAIFSPNAGQQ